MMIIIYHLTNTSGRYHCSRSWLTLWSLSQYAWCTAVLCCHRTGPLQLSAISSPSNLSSIPWPRGSFWHHRWIRNQFPPFFPVLHCSLGLGELQACPFPDVVFPPLPLSALSSSPFHCALQDGFVQTWWTRDMTIPLQFASLYDGQEIIMWSDCLPDLGTDFVVGNVVFVWDV